MTMIEQKKTWESYHTKVTNAQFNVSFHFINMFYSTAIYKHISYYDTVSPVDYNHEVVWRLSLSQWPWELSW
jgi:hypothetical protein